MVVAFDFDGVLNNLPDAWMNYLNNKYHSDVKELTHYSMNLNYPDLTHNQIIEPLYSETFWETVTPVDNCENELKNLILDTDYIVVTNTHPNIWNAKYNGCIKRNFPFIPSTKFILCAEKWRVKYEVLVDDFVDNFINVDGYKLLKDTTYNKKVSKFKYDDSFGALNDAIYKINNLSNIMKGDIISD